LKLFDTLALRFVEFVNHIEALRDVLEGIMVAEGVDAILY
jgi:hypothetical protein